MRSSNLSDETLEISKGRGRAFCYLLRRQIMEDCIKPAEKIVISVMPLTGKNSLNW
jgi:hypothetical protein